MTARSSSPTNPTAWQALREYLVDAYNNQEMRMLVEFTLLAEAGTRLPDERVPPQEYAANLCTLIQRHSGCPVPEFWRQLAADRPLRAREIDKLRAFFVGAVASGAATPLPVRQPARRGRNSRPLLAAALLIAIGTATVYYASVGPRPNVVCRDGTISPTCDEPRPGCCSGHGGLRPAEGERERTSS